MFLLSLLLITSNDQAIFNFLLINNIVCILYNGLLAGFMLEEEDEGDELFLLLSIWKK